MASIKLTGDTSGEITISAPAVAGTNTLTLPAETGTIVTNVNGNVYPLASGTAVTATGSETSIDFTGIPSWVKKITISFREILTSTSDKFIVQLGTSGGFVTSGYESDIMQVTTSDVVSRSTSSAGLLLSNTAVSTYFYGLATLALLDSGQWAYQTNACRTGNSTTICGGGGVDISGTLTQLRFTTDNGTYTFDSGSKINILYE